MQISYDILFEFSSTFGRRVEDELQSGTKYTDTTKELQVELTTLLT